MEAEESSVARGAEAGAQMGCGCPPERGASPHPRPELENTLFSEGGRPQRGSRDSLVPCGSGCGTDRQTDRQRHWLLVEGHKEWECM